MQQPKKKRKNKDTADGREAQTSLLLSFGGIGLTIIRLKKRKDNRIELGHPWVYQSEIESVQGTFVPGDIVTVVNHAGAQIGQGYINPQSQIAVRILTRDTSVIDQDFFRRRIHRAWHLRRDTIADDTDSYRLIHGESDYLPALIVDKYGDYLVVQFLSLGMDVRKDTIIHALIEVLNPRGIYERSDVNVRKLEGLPLTKGFLLHEFPTRVPIMENGYQFMVDIENGQKTGYFFDQRENRKAIAPYVKDRKILDCFSYVGSFSVHAAGYGAEEVLGIDISEDAVAVGQENLRLNGLASAGSFLGANVFDELRIREQRGEHYGMIILDPPAFTKSKHSVPGALRGYKEINLRAMKMIQDGGYLITSSCSHHISEDIFWQMLQGAAADAGKSVQIVEKRSQGKDHPILLASRETQYLKFFILRIFK